MDKEVDCMIGAMIKNRWTLKFIDQNSLLRLINDEVFLIMQPTFSAIAYQDKKLGTQGLFANSKDILMKVCERRLDLVLEFAEDIFTKCVAFNEINSCNKISIPIEFVALTSDSHNGGRRPVLIKRDNGDKVVLKFADPRNYLITQSVVRFVSEGIGVDLTLPCIKEINSDGCYFSDFLKEKEIQEPEIPEFMFAMGVLTAVAFCMGFVDLHLENIIAVGKRPVIVDPECMLYNFAIGASIEERLWSTGLLSHNIHLSSLRGGISKSHPLVDFKMHDAGGVVKYSRSVAPHRNKVRMSSGDFADAKNFKKDILLGYDMAYDYMIKNRDGFISLLESSIDDDVRIRYLARKTRHYASVIYMLNLPSIYGQSWASVVLSRFRESGAFLDDMPEGVFQAEVHDLSNRDVPYFWLKAGERGVVHHSTGIVHDLGLIKSPRQWVVDDFLSLELDGKFLQKKVIEDFLSMEI